MIDNNYIDKNLQKGFWKGVDGVTEHTEMLAHILKTAKQEQRSVTVALLDLRNAFGEVNHNLIAAALKFHHAPLDFIQMFQSIYENNFIVVSMANKVTDPIRVERGVLQGDPCSPLLFNLCFNTLMLTLNQPIYRKLGFSWGSRVNRQERAWLQFADDAAIVASDNVSAQGLLNLFEAWCTWADMSIRLDKCTAFGMQKRNGVYTQTMPILSVNTGQIPPVPLSGEFTYLGRRFSFESKPDSIKAALEQKLKGLLNITSGLKIKAQTKIKILSLYVHAQMLHEIKLYDLPVTWIEQSLDALCVRHIRDWLEMPISACVNEIASMPRKMAGLGIPSFKHLSQKLCLTKRYALRTSASADVRELWSNSSSRHVVTDQRIVSHGSIAAAAKSLKLDQQNSDINHLLSLEAQGKSVKCVTETVSSKNIETWASTLDNLPNHLFNFARKALIQVLPTAANLKRWNRVQDASCPLCAGGTPQTNKHVLSNCSSATALHRYTIRHNDILAILISWIKACISSSQSIYADLSDANVLPVCDLFHNCRPDLAICDTNSINILELTVCHETNMTVSNDYKKNKYRNISLLGSSLAGNRKIIPHFIEVSTLGFISNCLDFTKAIEIDVMPDSIKHKIVACAVKSSFGIYCNRNSAALNTA